MRSGRGVDWSKFFVLQELDSQIESLRDALRLSQTLSDGRNRHLDQSSAAARRDVGAIKATLAKREAERLVTVSCLPGPSVLLYDKLRARHELRPWVVWLSAGFCPACNLVIPTALLCAARRTKEPTPCPSCLRLLIWRANPPPASSSGKPGT